ncbi:MAG TPA: arsenate reductase ArsC [Parvibaculum sp.]|uniref:arsenate reductase ArsC n=1 Tax=Parvibaculum sp. TaxID=2024848 RepID=UPI002C993BE5|nr:arsenate reductase ArsC [Parvibaculum sp.]HMM15766.1 arsenate reductase ArsC [Parvibaculum sp.]
MTGHKSYNVLFLCTGNSARSILAEVYMNARGGGRFRAYSAGSQPTGRVNPRAIEALRSAGLPTENLRSKSWDEFAAPGAPQMDFIITVCDNAAGEVCPVWPGHPASAHWPFEDPAAATGSEEAIRRKFAEVFAAIGQRIDLLAGLPLGSLDEQTLRKKLAEIGETGSPA